MTNTAHLTVKFGLDAEIDQVKNYGRKSGQARNGVDLTKGQIQTKETQRKAQSPRTHIVHR